jgi:hypothetical protein
MVDGPNPGDRIGYTRVAWEDKPFWWEGPSSGDRVLFWNPTGGYAFGHGIPNIIEGVRQALSILDREQYPYDLTCLRWSKGDNGLPDEGAIDLVRDWNARYAFPQLVMATTTEACHALVERYGAQLPTHRGDFTPYWEDGCGSAATETALNRHSADRLTQAEALFALLGPAQYPAAEFSAAWRNVALFSEHTWGAWCSISQPDSPFTKEVWRLKQAWALDADRQSQDLLSRALALRGAPAAGAVAAVDVFNTAGWPRTDLVTLPADWKLAGERVLDAAGGICPSQRLASGELAFLARDVPACGAARFALTTALPTGSTTAEARTKVAGTSLSSPQLTLTVDPQTGVITSLKRAGDGAELADPAGGGLNSYHYLLGGNPREAQPSGPATVKVGEDGELVASLMIESPAPGCRSLRREVRLVNGLDRVEVCDTMDKLRERRPEGVHLGFAFNVPQPTVRVNSAMAVTEVEREQLIGACRNWYCVERWLDVSNETRGLTLASADALLFEVGGLTAHLPREQGNPAVYLAHVEPSARIFAWALNNHWETNYKADQEGPIVQRYAIAPHAAYDPLAAARFGVEATEPLLPAPAAGPAPGGPRLTLSPAGVVLQALKPSDDGAAWIARLWNPGAQPQRVTLNWAEPRPARVSLSGSLETPGEPLAGPLTVPARGVVTVRAERP